MSRIKLFLFACLAGLITTQCFAQANSAASYAGTSSDPVVTVGGGWYAFDWSGSGQPYDQEGAFTFTTTTTTLLTVTDSFCPGDQFKIFDAGIPIGVTTPVAVSSVCTPFSPDVALANPIFSHGKFVLGPGSHVLNIQTITNPFPPGTAYLRVDSFNGSTDLLDPISSSGMLSGNNISTNPFNTAFISSSVITRLGVAADGTAKLVLRFNAPSAGTVSFALADSGGNPLSGSPVNGVLTDLQGGAPSNISTVSTFQGQKAFAIYTAPTRFADDSGVFRSVYIRPTFSPTGGGMITQPLTTVRVVRPLVWLVHGIWSCNTSWNTSAFSVLMSDPRFTVHAADYRDDPGGACTASKSFASSAQTVYQQLIQALVDFRKTSNVAAVQADLVTHSMGGPVVRTIALQSTFQNDPLFPTFGSGPIHKLITVAGVHLGTPFATFALSSACYTQLFDNLGKAMGNGAVADLAPSSSAIAAINAAHTVFPAHTIIGLADTFQKAANTTEINLRLSIAIGTPSCWTTIFPGFDSVLGSSSDLLVPKNSQSANNAVPSSSPFSDTIHSGWPLWFPPGSYELGSSDIVNEIISLLNNSADDATVFQPF